MWRSDRAMQDMVHGLSQLDGLQIVGHVDVPAEHLCAFRGIQLFAVCQILLFSVVKNHIAHTQALRQLARICRRRVMNAVGMIDVGLRAQAKRLMQQPVRILHVGFTRRAARLIATAHELLSVRQLHTKAELLVLGRLDVEKFHGASGNFKLFAVMHFNQMQTLADKFVFACAK